MLTDNINIQQAKIRINNQSKTILQLQQELILLKNDNLIVATENRLLKQQINEYLSVAAQSGSVERIIC